MLPDEPTIEAFLLTGQRNAWCCEQGPIAVYVRRSLHRVSEGEVAKTLDIANLKTEQPGTGKLGALFEEAERLVKVFNFGGVFVESVMDQWLRDWLVDRGYTKLVNAADPHDLAPHFFKHA
jgi:hypothetical protein